MIHSSQKSNTLIDTITPLHVQAVYRMDLLPVLVQAAASATTPRKDWKHWCMVWDNNGAL